MRIAGSIAGLCIGAAFIAAFLTLPFGASAQTATSGDALSSTIRAELLSDPRTHSMSDAQLNAMVQLLAQQARSQGISAQDLTWRPAPSASLEPGAPVQPTCGSIPGPLCALNQAFGLDGADPTLPVGLCITAAVLIILIGILLERKHRAMHAVSHVAMPQ